MIHIKRGLDLPLKGEPKQEITEGQKVTQVAILGPDYNGMKPTMAVQVGDKVKLGQLLFTDKKNAGVRYVAPGAGTISAINRGDQRALLSVVIDLDANEEAIRFQSYKAEEINTLDRASVQANLVESGLWSAFKTRPYSKAPHLGSAPHSIFVTAIDTNPCAANPGVVLANQKEDFNNGLSVLKRLTDGRTYLCIGAGDQVPATAPGIRVEKFIGKHPAGLPGTHIHFLDPVNHHKTVWSINYQDVVAIGKLFTTGNLSVERVISLGGPAVKNPRLIKTRLGAKISQLTQNEIQAGDNRVISGSVFYGHTAEGALDFLGRFNNQVTVLPEGRKRHFMGWQMPGFSFFSIKPVYASHPYNFVKRSLDTTTGGSKRAMVPSGMYEEVLPLDLEPVYLLRALIVQDTDDAQKLGCLELDEEDLALCTFVCTGKYDYGPILRENLTKIEKEG